MRRLTLNNADGNGITPMATAKNLSRGLSQPTRLSRTSFVEEEKNNVS
jgi:hypothetical protein